MSFEVSTLEADLAASEARVKGLREGCQKQVVWADGVAKAPLAIVYVHGFSASPAEVRPLPDRVAEALGANLFFTRLEGHGQDGAAMGRATLAAWEADVAEALEIGAALGDEVIVMGCSTGCTLLTSALAHGGKTDAKGGALEARVTGIVHLSPNFGLRNGAAHLLLQMPGVRRWGPWLVGKERSFAPISQAHSRYWTVKYDTQAVFTMADAVRSAMASPIEAIKVPAYFAYAKTDSVVHPAKTEAVMRRWGGSVAADILVQGQGDDPDGHVMAGDVFSPAQTGPLAERIIAWAKAL